MLKWLVQNEWLLALGFVGLAYWLLQYMAYNKAKQVALKYLAVAHKIAVGSASVEVAALSKVAYAALPPVVKPFLPPVVFEAIVLEMYNEVLQIIEQAHHKAEQAPQEKKEEKSADKSSK